MLLEDQLKDFRLILSSASPRRQNFFKGMGFDFVLDIRPVEEVYSDSLKEEEITNYLAKLKATPFDDLKEKDILVTSDTIVWLQGKPLEKAANRDEAIAMLTALSGNYHEVITSICITTTSKQLIMHDKVKVWFDELSQEQIAYYIDTHKPYDKAGSYGIQEWLGYVAVPRIEGSFFTVMGLPTHLVYQGLSEIVNSQSE
ncbi:Maf family protein [Gilvibacter sediminis]|uniref:Maf family protein n=1 Tax=Gilvibacter sediminis TaxID=379071 RepID=UPI002350C504|nr:Maf family protein [Gilvibacter sediminis]MDC7998189.1 Maf family protein [Gilvibacter sediminis]